MKNWRTTLGGILSAVGLTLSANPNCTCHYAGVILAAIGGLVLGVNAQDKKEDKIDIN